MDRRSVILAPSYFSRRDASNDTHDDPNGHIWQLDPGHSQGHHTAMDFVTCGGNTAKVGGATWMLQIFKKKLLQIVTWYEKLQE